MLSPQRAIEVFGFLSDFAKRYHQLCERDQRMYRDLMRAAMLSIDDEQKAESMLLQHSVDAVLIRVCREPIGEFLLRQLRAKGLRVSMSEASLRVGPKSKLTPELTSRITNWRHAIRDALLSEELFEGCDRPVSKTKMRSLHSA